MKVHLGWVSSDPPSFVLDAVAAVRAASPGCEVMFHPDESMVPPHWLEVSRFLRPQMRSDVQRHCILKKWGGLWLDVDVRVLKDPAEWTNGWAQYTATKFGHLTATDIIYVPPGWGGWELVDGYIDRVLTEVAATRRVKLLALAGRMIDACQRREPDAFQVLADAEHFAFDPSLLTADSFVARGFDPPATPRPGLGDLATKVLSAVGITEARAQAVAKAVGIKDCGCGRRRAAMNRLGERLGLPPGSTASTENQP